MVREINEINPIQKFYNFEMYNEKRSTTRRDSCGSGVVVIKIYKNE